MGISLLMLVSSCVSIDDLVIHESDTVELRLVMDVASESASDTKAVIDPEVMPGTEVSALIKNFWVIQFNGIDDNAKIVGEPQYYVFDDKFESDKKIKLVMSKSENVVWFIANTFDPAMGFSQGSTLKDLKNRWMKVDGAESLMAESGDDHYLMFNGCYKGVITDDKTISCSLKRNIARINITIKNSSGDDEVIIKDWQLKQVPILSYYVTNYELPDLFPADASIGTSDYPVMTPDAGLGTFGPGKTTSFQTYLPVNKKGIVSNNVEGYKNFYAPSGAAYFQINGTYRDAATGDDMPVSYLFYLGGDMVSDFNLLPNHSYDYVFEIKGKGSAEDDYRVKDWGVVDFANADDETANCYVINPASIDGYSRKFRIPVKRVDEFWGGNGYESNSSMTLGTGNDWYVKLIVSNFDNSDEKFRFIKSAGTGSYNAETSKLEYFEFAVAPETVGNAVVAIYLASDTEGTYPLWSWHLWITDYAPDEAFYKRPEDGEYKYTVTGGEVHRYDNGIWDEEYSDRFIMDRDLGAPNNYQYLNAGNGSCYYQYGRKDPFFGHNSTLYGGSFGVKQYADLKVGETDMALEWSVHNPLMFIQNSQADGYWTKNAKYNPDDTDVTMLWQDPYTSTAEYGESALRKSIFDPCPPGYCVPEMGAWDDIRTQREAKPTTNNYKNVSMVRNFKELDKVSDFKVSYWPYPDGENKDDVPEVPIYIPVTGYKSGQTISGLAASSQAYILYHAANAYSKGQSYRKAIKYDNSDSPSINVKFWGYTVRCVTARDPNYN